MLLTSAAVWGAALLDYPSRMHTDFCGRVGIWTQPNPWVSCFLEVVNQRIRSCDARPGVWWKADAAFTFAEVSHADTADWPGGKVRSGEGWHGSRLSSLCPSDKNEEMGDFVSEFSSSLSISRATKLGLESKKKHSLTQSHTAAFWKRKKYRNLFMPEVATVHARAFTLTVGLRGGRAIQPGQGLVSRWERGGAWCRRRVEILRVRRRSVSDQ